MAEHPAKARARALSDDGTTERRLAERILDAVDAAGDVSEDWVPASGRPVFGNRDKVLAAIEALLTGRWFLADRAFPVIRSSGDVAQQIADSLLADTRFVRVSAVEERTGGDGRALFEATDGAQVFTVTVVSARRP